MIKDLEQAKRILGQIEEYHEVSEILIRLIKGEDYQTFDQEGMQLLGELVEVYEEFVRLKEEEPELEAATICECIVESLRCVLRLALARSPKTLAKIEFEVIPLVEELYTHFYFKGCVVGDKEKTRHYLITEKPKLYSNKYLKIARETGVYTYELSIIVVAYNKLEMTKCCVESLLSYVPKDLSYELILLNHGSTDGTKEYFESIAPTKQLDLYKNGGGMHAVHRIVEGKYQLIISNDVLVTENAIANMLACMKSDEKIQWVVPTTPNISNLQSISTEYKTLEEMYNFASQNNVQDPYRWEQRARLCDPIAMSKDVWDVLSHTSYFDNWLGFSFPDDKTSLALRRKGYKMMLAKDAYCYHFGSQTLKEEIAKKSGGADDFYRTGRKKFQEECGIDPWGTGFCWGFEPLILLPCNLEGHIDLLGINCGIGSNPLKIKEYIKELTHNTDVTLYNVTDDFSYILDLEGVSDEAKYVEHMKELPQVLEGKQFDYILFESKLKEYENPCHMIEQIMRNFLKENGIFAFTLGRSDLKEELTNKYPNLKNLGAWYTLTRGDVI
ncbi:MAG: glycosyltransferase [Cellulosilyticaceae bacterium]